MHTLISYLTYSMSVQYEICQLISAIIHMDDALMCYVYYVKEPCPYTLEMFGLVVHHLTLWKCSPPTIGGTGVGVMRAQGGV